MNATKPLAEPKWTALVAGGSGLVGGQLLPTLVASPEFARVLAVTRRPLAYDHPKLGNRIVRFEALEESLVGTRADVAFCCLGTTLKAAGSEASFRQIDHDYTLAFARAALKAGVRRFVLNSSIGADPASKHFYLRVKGETEAAIVKLGFAALDIFQPGLLLGTRTELRAVELAAMLVLAPISPLMLGKLEPYRAVRASTVAAAMLGAARSGRMGNHRYSWRAIQDLAQLRRSRRR